MKVLIVGGSGFLSGTVAREALDAGHAVWVVTRGQRPAPEGVRAIVADRGDDAAFQQAVAAAGERWDLVIDCIGFNAGHARQDLAAFADRADHLVFVSTDFVLDPMDRPDVVDETYERFDDRSDYGRGKRAAEEVLLAADGAMPVTVVRPCHIYGPGSQLGCLPCHGRDPRLIRRLLDGEPLRLVAGGELRQQPIEAADLAKVLLGVAGNERTHGQLYFAAGPEVVPSHAFYRIIAQTLGTPLRIEAVGVAEHLREKPGDRSFCCHRVYDLTKLRRHGLPAPSTPLAEGLARHVAWMREVVG